MPSRAAGLTQMLAHVDEAEAILEDSGRDLDDFGRLLDESWKIKRNLAKAVSTDAIDLLYQKAIDAGALGGKLLGAGGGGFFIFYVDAEKRAAVREALSDLLYVPFRFENGGTRVIHYTPENYVPRERELID